MRQNRPAIVPKALTLKRFFVLACALVFLVAAFVPVSFAASSAATYSGSSACTTSQTAFKLGDTVHGYGSGLTGGPDIVFEYTSGATTFTSSTVAFASTLCDATGYAPATAGTWTLTVASCTENGNSGNCKSGSITTLATSTFYIDTATVATYSNSACTTSASSFNAGTTIYAGGTETGGPFSVNFVSPSSTTAASDSVATSGSYCVSYAVPSNAQTGNWTVTVTESSDSVAEQIQTSTPTFTLNGAVPDIPFGVLPLVLIVPALYLVMRRSLGHS